MKICLSGTTGQAMVESALVFGFLMVVFLSLLNFGLLVTDKIRSLDTVFHLARAQQVAANPSRVIMHCFGKWGIWESSDLSRHPQPVIREVRLTFAHGSAGMRTTLSDKRFLDVSWPGARRDERRGWP